MHDNGDETAAVEIKNVSGTFLRISCCASTGQYASLSAADRSASHCVCVSGALNVQSVCTCILSGLIQSVYNTTHSSGTQSVEWLKI